MQLSTLSPVGSKDDGAMSYDEKVEKHPDIPVSLVSNNLLQ